MHVAIVAIISMSLSAENRTHDFIERLEECQLISREELGSLISLRRQSRVEPYMNEKNIPPMVHLLPESCQTGRPDMARRKVVV